MANAAEVPRRLELRARHDSPIESLGWTEISICGSTPDREHQVLLAVVLGECHARQVAEWLRDCSSREPPLQNVAVFLFEIEAQQGSGNNHRGLEAEKLKRGIQSLAREKHLNRFVLLAYEAAVLPVQRALSDMSSIDILTKLTGVALAWEQKESSQSDPPVEENGEEEEAITKKNFIDTVELKEDLRGKKVIHLQVPSPLENESMDKFRDFLNISADREPFSPEPVSSTRKHSKVEQPPKGSHGSTRERGHGSSDERPKTTPTWRDSEPRDAPSFTHSEKPEILGSAFLDRWDLENAEKFYSGAKAKYEKDPVKLASMQFSLALISLRKGQFQEADEQFRYLGDENRAPQLRSAIMCGLAHSQVSFRGWEKSKVHLTDFAAKSGLSHDDHEFQVIQDVLASLDLKLGNFDQAKARAEKNLDMWSAKRRRSLCNVLKLLGNAAKVLEDLKPQEQVEEKQVEENQTVEKRPPLKKKGGDQTTDVNLNKGNRDSEISEFQRQMAKIKEAETILDNNTEEAIRMKEAVFKDLRVPLQSTAATPLQRLKETRPEYSLTRQVKKYWNEILQAESALQNIERRYLDCSFILTKVYLEKGQTKRVSEKNQENIRRMSIVWGPNHVVTLKALHLESQIFLADADFAEAEKTCKNALNAMRERLGFQHHLVLEILGTLVKVYCARGCLSDAEEVGRYLVRQTRHCLKTLLIESYGHLAEVLDLLGRPGDAEKEQEMALRYSTETLGPSHPVTLANHARLAGIRCKTGDISKACHNLGILVGFFLEHSDLQTGNILAVSTLRMAGHASRLVALHLKGQGDDLENWMTVSSQFLDRALHRTGRKEESEEDAERLSDDDAEILLAKFEREVWNRDTAVLGGQQEMGKILDKMRELQAKRSKQTGNQHPTILGWDHETCITLCLMERWDDAQEEARRVYSNRLDVLGHGHPEVLQSKLQLAEIDARLGNFEEAEPLLLDIIDQGKESKKSMPNGCLVAAMSDLASLYFSGNNFEGAKRLQVELLKELAELYHPQHPEILICGYNLALTLRNLDRNDIAIPLVQEVVEKLKEMGAPEEREMRDTLQKWGCEERKGESESIIQQMLQEKIAY